MIRQLLDENLPRSAVPALRAAGWECAHVLDHGLGSTADERILAWAATERWVLVTEDADFPALLALGRGEAPSVVFLRIQGMNRTTLPQLLKRLLPSLEEALAAGALVSIEAAGARVRSLPVLPP